MSKCSDTHDKYLWYVERDSIALVERDGAELVSVKDANLTLGVTGVKRAASFDGDSVADHLDQVSELPAHLHLAIAYKTIAEFYRDPRNLNPQMSQFYESEYKQLILEGKKHAKRGYLGNFTIKPQDY
tara:strand:+ start:1499 stop:1882 length:384 start_codon:yes stop_codon:yes gene_type:complete